MIAWNIQSRSRFCQACEKPFAPKDAYHTLLSDERHSYARLDVCGVCWENQYSQGASDRKGFVSHWLGIYMPPLAASAEPIAKETAESLLRKLINLNEPQYLRACYILAVILERKRLLRIQSQLVREGQRIFIYEHPKSGDLFTIPDPNLQLDQLEELQREIGHLLGQDGHHLASVGSSFAPEADGARVDCGATEASVHEEEHLSEQSVAPE